MAVFKAKSVCRGDPQGAPTNPRRCRNTRGSSRLNKSLRRKILRLYRVRQTTEAIGLNCIKIDVNQN